MSSVPQVKPLRRSFIRFPTQVEFGAGMLKRLGEFTEGYGKKAFCLFDPFFKGSEAAKTAVEALHAMECPEAEWFIETMLPAYTRTLDELTRQE